MKLTFLFGSLFLGCFIFLNAHAASSLSYSGRLVSNNGAPVVGPVKLRFDLAYNTDTTDILCTDEINGLDLINGVFHAKLDFDCGASTSLENILLEAPSGSTVSIRVTDVTNSSSHRVYSFQALHSIPSSIVAGMANQLAPLNASAAGEVLTWDGGKWKAAPPVSTGGTLTSITAHEGLSGGTITGAGSIGIADGGVTAAKLHSMGANSSGQVLKWNGASWAAGFDEDNGVIASNVRKFALNNNPLFPAPACSGHQVLRYVLLTDTLECFNLVNDDIDEAKSDLAPSQKAVAEALELKQDKIESSLKLTSGTNSVTLQAPSSGGDIIYTLPPTGVSGKFLKLGPLGVLTWEDVGVSGSDIATNSITNSHVADGALSQSKVNGLTTDLTAIGNRITNLKTDDVDEGAINKYFTNDKVIQAPLTNLNPTIGPVTGIDSILVAFNKIVGNANDLASAVSTLEVEQSNYLLRDGTSPMIGNLDMGLNLITKLAPPSADDDAATKKYVDDKANVSVTWLKNVPDIYYNSGNVGIGTTAPSSILHITPPDDSWDSSIRLDRSWDSVTDFAQIMYDYQGLKIRTMDDGDDEAHIIFKPKDSEALRITETGNIGIGTPAPNHKLEIKSNSTHAGVGLDASVGSASYIDFNSAGTKVANVFFDGANDIFKINSLGIKDTSINHLGGNVGIGTASPNSRLTVDGALAIKEGAPPILTADYGKLYVKTADSKLYFMNDSGVETVLGSSDGGTPGDNTITSSKITDGSIVNADINAAAGIDTTKIGNADVDNTELSYLNGVTSSIQTQINNIRQVPTGTDTTMYLRGDNSWQTLDTSVVPETVSRQYFTQQRVLDSLLSGYAAAPAVGIEIGDGESVLSSLKKLQLQITANDTAFDSTGQWGKNLTKIYYNSGNVGIGTTNPDYPLNVVKTGVEDSSIVVGATGTGKAGIYLDASNGDALGSDYLSLYQADDLKGHLFVGQAGVASDLLIQEFGGNVGIGTSAPAAKLDVGGSFRSITPYAGYAAASINHKGGGGYGQFEITNSNTNNDVSFFSMHSAGNTAWTQGILGTSFVLSNTAGVEKTYNHNIRLTVTNTGSVGVGTTAPSERLEVVGNVKAAAYLYTSDRRLKENIETIENSSEKVLGLRGVEFDWKKDGKHEIGFIAQEVEAIEPNLVVTSEVDGIKAVKYGNVVALLVEAFKEHHQKLEENQKLFMTMNQGMNTRVKELEREVASLKDENKKLKEDIELIKKHLKIK